MLPILSNGLFDNSRKEIDLFKDDKKNNVICNIENYKNKSLSDLKNEINNSKRGFVFFFGK